MSIKFYAGILKDDGTVDKFVPINIVKPIGNPTWNSGKAYSYYSLPDELPCYTGLNVKYFDEAPIDLLSVVRELYAISTEWTSSQWSSLFNGSNTINFFSSENVNSIYNFSLHLNSVTYQSNSRIFTRFQFGDLNRNIVWKFETNMGSSVRKCILAFGENYNSDNFEDLLNTAKEFEQIAFDNTNYYQYMHYPQYMLFSIFYTSEDNNTLYTFNKYAAWQNGVNNFGINLSRWANWYTMITGKYYYGQPYKIELKHETNGLKYIELGVPIYQNIQLCEGFASDNYSSETYGKRVGISYYNVGTNLYRLFDSSLKVGTETIALKSGYLSRTILDNSRVIFTLSSNNKGIKVEFSTKSSDDYNKPTIDTLISIGCYLFVHKDYATMNLNSWIYSINKDYNHYEYGNSPLFFASYITSNAGVVYFDYDNHEQYPNSRNVGIVANYRISNHWSTFIDDSYPIDYQFWEDFILGNKEDPKNPNIGGGSIGGGSSGSGGGEGAFDDTTNDTGISDQPIPFLSNYGNIFRVYLCTNSELNELGAWLNSETLKLSNDTRLESIISLAKIRTPDRTSPEISGSENIILGGYDSGVTGDVVQDRYIRYIFGQLKIPEYYGSFLDYGNNTTISIYLPYVGTKELPTDEFMNKTLILSCDIDLVSGNVTYNIGVTDGTNTNYRYSFSGICNEPIPLTNTDYSGKLSTIISGIVGLAGSISVGNPIATLGSATTLISGLNQTPHINKTGQLNSMSGSRFVQYPYVTITRPKQSLPDNYGSLYGYPSNITKKLGDLTGYTVVDSIHLENMGIATKDEIDEIEQLLKSGVIL